MRGIIALICIPPPLGIPADFLQFSLARLRTQDSSDSRDTSVEVNNHLSALHNQQVVQFAGDGTIEINSLAQRVLEDLFAPEVIEAHSAAYGVVRSELPTIVAKSDSNSSHRFSWLSVALAILQRFPRLSKEERIALAIGDTLTTVGRAMLDSGQSEELLLWMADLS